MPTIREVRDVMLFDEYVSALQKDSKAEPPPKLSEDLVLWAQEMVKSMATTPEDSERLSKIWQRALREAQAIQRAQQISSDETPSSPSRWQQLKDTAEEYWDLCCGHRPLSLPMLSEADFT